MLGYFLKSYQECRSAFLERAEVLRSKYKYSKIEEIKIGKSNYAIDCLHLQKRKTNSKNLILLSSGVHGVEGYYGSAIQSLILDEYITGRLPLNSDLLFLHGINPYGFENNRRTNENNIDLNRNFFLKREKLPKKGKNFGYKKFSSFFMPKFPFTFWGIEYLIFSLRFGGILIRIGVRKFTDALVNGQFQYKKGIYYGGKKPETVVKKLKAFLLTKTAKYERILFLDYHTGHGEKNKLVLIQNALPGSKEDQNIASIVSGLPLLRPDNSTSFYKTQGDFIDFFERISPGHPFVYPLTVEMGTLGNLDLFGALRGTFLMIAENRIYHRGAWFESSQKKVEKKFLDYFYPNHVLWKKNAIRRSRAVSRILIQRFEALA